MAASKFGTARFRDTGSSGPGIGKYNINHDDPILRRKVTIGKAEAKQPTEINPGRIIFLIQHLTTLSSLHSIIVLRISLEKLYPCVSRVPLKSRIPPDLPSETTLRTLRTHWPTAEAVRSTASGGTKEFYSRTTTYQAPQT